MRIVSVLLAIDAYHGEPID